MYIACQTQNSTSCHLTLFEYDACKAGHGQIANMYWNRHVLQVALVRLALRCTHVGLRLQVAVGDVLDRCRPAWALRAGNSPCVAAFVALLWSNDMSFSLNLFYSRKDFSIAIASCKRQSARTGQILCAKILAGVHSSSIFLLGRLVSSSHDS